MFERLRSHRCRATARWVWVIVAALALGNVLVSAAEPVSRDASEDRPGVRLRLDRERLAPRVSLQLESLATFRSAGVSGNRLDDHVMFDELTDSVRRGAESVTRKAVRDHLFELIGLDQGIDRVRQGVRGTPSDSRSVRWHFGVHSAQPQVGVRSRVGDGTLRFNVGAEGNMSIRFRRPGVQKTEFSAAFDGDDTYVLRARLGF